MDRFLFPTEVDMRFLMAIVAVAVLSGAAHAGPFRRSVTTTRASTCSGTSCSTASSRTVTRGGAQAHAEAMAASGSMVHAASHGATYEGVGVGGSPAAALGACCNNGGAVLEEGVARGRDGRWYACRRYSLR
jgi:hypothetical protein